MGHRNRRLITLAAVAAFALTACGDDDASDSTSAGDSSEGSSADSDLVEDLAAEADELGVELSDEELAEAADMVAGDADGSATVLVDGEEIEMTSVSCSQGSEWWAVEASNRDWGIVQVRFRHDLRPDAEPGDYRFDEGTIRFIPNDDTMLLTPTGEDGPITGDESSARGTGIVWDIHAEEDEREASAVEVDLDITCAG